MSTQTSSGSSERHSPKGVQHGGKGTGQGDSGISDLSLNLALFTMMSLPARLRRAVIWDAMASLKDFSHAPGVTIDHHPASET